MRKLLLAIAAAVTVSASIVSCKDNYIDPTQETFTRDTATISTYAKAQSLSVITADYGVRYAITKTNPTGKVPVQADELEFQYTISRIDGTTSTVVDISARDTAIYFPFGLNAMKVGLEVGFAKMREGEKAIFLIPSYAAFGNQVSSDGKIPANTPVRFDVTLNRSRSEDQQIEAFIERNKYTVAEKQTNGIRVIKTTPVPTGAVLIDGQTVTVKYSGRLLRASKPFGEGSIDISLGRGNAIAGLETGLKSFKVGEKGTIVFPSTLGYGATGRSDATTGKVVIPPYAPLAFDVEVVSAK